MTSWGHTIDRIPEAEMQRIRQRVESWGPEWRARYGAGCSGPKCQEIPEYRCFYRYVTGRAGRMTTARKSYCPQHVARFAAKHGLGMPTGDAGPTGSEVA